MRREELEKLVEDLYEEGSPHEGVVAKFPDGREQLGVVKQGYKSTLLCKAAAAIERILEEGITQ